MGPPHDASYRWRPIRAQFRDSFTLTLVNINDTPDDLESSEKDMLR